MAIRWLNPPAPEDDVRIMEEHREELLACIALEEEIHVATGRRAYRVLLPSHWGLTFTGAHAVYAGLLCERGGVAEPCLVYNPNHR